MRVAAARPLEGAALLLRSEAALGAAAARPRGATGLRTAERVGQPRLQALECGLEVACPSSVLAARDLQRAVGVEAASELLAQARRVAPVALFQLEVDALPLLAFGLD